MLDELAPLIDEPKARDFINRIESKLIEQSLPGEMELAVVWAIAQLGSAEIEPEWYSPVDSLPDILSDTLIPDHETIVDVVGLSDAALPGDKGMRNASRKLSHEAGRIRRGAAKHLSYYFFEETNRVASGWIRRVCTPTDLKISKYIRDALTSWLRKANLNDGDKFRLKERELDVLITWHDASQSAYNFQTSMPPEVRSLADNYIYRALKAKAGQLKNPMFSGLRCVILADVGSTALRDADRVDHSGRVYNAAQIGHEFLLREGRRLDVINLVTPKRRRRRIDRFEETVEWEQTILCRPGLYLDTSGFERMLAVLPTPNLEGYQARQLHEQQVFSPTRRGRYMGTLITWTKGEKTEIRFSSRAFLDLLAGRETPERFMRQVGLGEANIFKGHLDRGETISEVRLESGGPDEDDDHIVVVFKDDPGARPLNRT